MYITGSILEFHLVLFDLLIQLDEIQKTIFHQQNILKHMKKRQKIYMKSPIQLYMIIYDKKVELFLKKM